MLKQKSVLKVLIAIGLLISLGIVGVLSFRHFRETHSPSVSNDPIESQVETLRMAVLSEPRVFPDSLFSDSPAFAEVVSSDIAMLAESQFILDEAVREIIREAPDVLLVSGNLTKDGEVLSHEFLAERLNQIKVELPEIHIYVIPGSRDVNNSNALSFATEVPTAVASATPECFRLIYCGLGFGDAASNTFIPSDDGAGWGSYVARPAPGFTFMAIDTNTLEGTNASGRIDSELLQWIVEQAEEAKRRGDTVIAFMHHSLVPHSYIQSILFPDTLLGNYQEVVPILADVGIRYVFTSALRATDINRINIGENTLTDISTASLSAYPSPIRWATFTRVTDAENRRTEQVDISTSWITSLDVMVPLTGQYVNDLREHGERMVTEERLHELIMEAGLSDALYGTLDELENATFTNTEGVTHTGLRAALESALPTEDEAGNPVSNCMGAFMVSVLAETLPNSDEEGIVIARVGRLFYESDPGRIRIQLPGGIIGGSLFITNDNFKQYLVNPTLTQLNQTLLVDRTIVNEAIDQMSRELLGMIVYPLSPPDAWEGDPSEGNQITLYQLMRVAFLNHLAGDEQVEPWMFEVIGHFTVGGPLLDKTIEMITENLEVALSLAVDSAVNAVYVDTDSLITASGLVANGARLVLIAMLDNNLGTLLDTFGLEIDEMLGDLGDLFSEEMQGDIATLVTGAFLALLVNYGYPNDNFTSFQSEF